MANKIALVDDDQNIIASVSVMLEQEGYEVDCYFDGDECNLRLVVSSSIFSEMTLIQQHKTVMRLIEDKISYVDSVNFEILAQLVMVENKIVTLANSFTEMYDLKSSKSSANISA